MAEAGAMVIGSFPDVCVASVADSVRFYLALLELDVIVDQGWYAELGTGTVPRVAFVEASHETVPAAVGGPPRGVLLSFEVDDAGVAARAAARIGCPIAAALVSELGQRHLMVIDPDGAVVDIIERVPLTATDHRRLVRLRAASRGGCER
jgi:hypothetical protein